MKFYHGRWEKKMGVGVYEPKEICEYQIAERELTFLAPDSRIQNKGMTLDRVNITFRVSVPREEVFRIEMEHYKGGVCRPPHFDVQIHERELSVEESPTPLQTAREEELVVRSGRAELRIRKRELRMELWYDGERRTTIGPGDLCYIRTEDQGLLYEEFSGPAYMRAATGLSVGECIYGLGERFGPLVKNGQSAELFNEDGGTSTEFSYKNVPFYISSRAYGVFINHSEPVSVEVGTDHVERTAFSVPGERLDLDRKSVV